MNGTEPMSDRTDQITVLYRSGPNWETTREQRLSQAQKPVCRAGAAGSAAAGGRGSLVAATP